MKKTFLIIFVLCITAFIYFLIVNINSKNMTFKQKIFKAVYPIFTWYSKVSGKNNKEIVNSNNIQPNTSFYSLSFKKNNGEVFSFDSLKGKKILLVNTASNCCYTNQYDALQELHEKEKDHLVILGFPSNDFKEQEQGNDADIAAFCKINFGVTFQLMTKSVVRKNAEQNNVFQWLSNKTQNGWCNKQPSWNFSKYIINEQGVLTHYFDPAISPLSTEVLNAIK